jgi:membrane protease YdiL (CAAX protease family)
MRRAAPGHVTLVRVGLVPKDAGVVRLPSAVATLLVVVVLAGLNIANHVYAWNMLWLGPVGSAALLLFARATGLTWSQLGLSRDRLRAGLLWGGGVIAVVALVYLAGVLLPVTRTAFLDVRYHLGPVGALVSAFVIIPVGTVLLEEIAFRSVLWGMLARHTRAWRVLLISSVLFGLWHVLPSLNMGSANRGVGEAASAAGSSAQTVVVVGTVLFTAVGGIVAGELRRRSGSLLASAGMHWATNAFGVLFGLLAWHLPS